ncbi:hypothetical protein KQI41_13150 [Tissierella pigra]|uniref:Uncharacterized protein n=1 Tax=Tissierella pigra TaxID=2607614 RepID=A0A6N7XIF2_9FIRM|nr:hypothetical protein [Tissierella pigra]MBU5427332.1 hypothetical protein [Tissierella pigra]MSU01416.1 hypothetical protein [Tissierella pigra]
MKEQKIIVIGVIEEIKNRISFQLLKEILSKFQYKTLYTNSSENIIILNKGYSNILLLDIKEELISSIRNMDIKFNIIIHTFLNTKSYEDHNTKNIFNNSEYIIVNCDEENWNRLLENNLKSIIISYGFNNKASINISSYNIDDIIEGNICFQREIKTINGNIIEPYELPIKINSRDKLDIYGVIATITTSLLMDIDIFSLKDFTRFYINKSIK